jgi:hypothetical protein
MMCEHDRQSFWTILREQYSIKWYTGSVKLDFGKDIEALRLWTCELTKEEISKEMGCSVHVISLRLGRIICRIQRSDRIKMALRKEFR